jgi:hypothetical protein
MSTQRIPTCNTRLPRAPPAADALSGASNRPRLVSTCAIDVTRRLRTRPDRGQAPHPQRRRPRPNGPGRAPSRRGRAARPPYVLATPSRCVMAKPSRAAASDASVLPTDRAGRRIGVTERDPFHATEPLGDRQTIAIRADPRSTSPVTASAQPRMPRPNASGLGAGHSGHGDASTPRASTDGVAPKRRSPAAWPAPESGTDSGSGGISRTPRDRGLRFGAVARFPEGPAQPVVQAPESGQVRGDVVELRGKVAVRPTRRPARAVRSDGALRCRPMTAAWSSGASGRAVVPQRRHVVRTGARPGERGPRPGRPIKAGIRAGSRASAVVGELAGRDRHAADPPRRSARPECRVQPLTLAMEQLGRGGLGQ